MNESAPASIIQLVGSGAFGAIIGWYVYYVNRYRKGDVQLGDLVTVVGVLGGASVLALFPARTDLFGAYGIGLFAGFFGYLIVLAIMVTVSKNFDVDWFLDGRRKIPSKEYAIPGDVASTARAMDMTPEALRAALRD